jgi:hypothetical protein
MAMVSFKLGITEGMQKEVAKDVIRSQKRRTAKELEEIVGGRRLIKLERYTNVARSHWTKSLNTDKAKEVFVGEGSQVALKNVAGQRVETVKRRREDQEGSERLKEMKKACGEATDLRAKDKVFHCGSCNSEVGALRTTFNLSDLEKKSWCGKCMKSHVSTSWKCACGTRWFQCKRHKEVPEIERQKKLKEESSKRKGVKRKAAEATEDLTTCDRQVHEKRNINFGRYACEEVCERGVRMGMLSESLQRKFGHLCTDAR